MALHGDCFLYFPGDANIWGRERPCQNNCLAILKANSCKIQSKVIMSWYAVDGNTCSSTSSQQPLMECSFCLQSIERENHPQCNFSLIWSQINHAVRHKGDSKASISWKYLHYTKHTLKHPYFPCLTLACAHFHLHTPFKLYRPPSAGLFLLSHSMSCLQSYSTNIYIRWVHTHRHTHSHPLSPSQNEPRIDSSHTSVGRNEQSLWIGKGVK